MVTLNIVFGQKIGDALNDEEGMSTVKRFAENVAYLVNIIKELIQGLHN